MAKHVRASMQPDYAVNIFACLDRFSLDSVGFTCPTLKEIVATHLPEEPLRVLESVTIEWHGNRQIATLVPESPLGKVMTVDEDEQNEVAPIGDPRTENMLRRTAALCANSFVKFCKIEEYGDWAGFLDVFRQHLPGIRIQRLMIVDEDHVAADYLNDDDHSRFNIEQGIIQLARGVETLVMKTAFADINGESLQWLKEHGIRRLAVDEAFDSVGEDGVRAFCLGGPKIADKAAPVRSLLLDQAALSFGFLQQLAQECLALDASRMPTVTFYRYTDFVPPLPEAQARHMTAGRRCLHFRFHAATGPYEIVAQSRGNQKWQVSLRGGHSAVRLCSYLFRRENQWAEG